MKNLSILLGRDRGRYVLVLVCSAVVTGSEVVIHPLLLKAVFDTISQHKSFHIFVYVALAYLALGLTINPLNYAISLWRMRVENRIVANASRESLRSFFQQNYGDILREGNGHYVSRIRSDIKDGVAPILGVTRDIVVNTVSFVLLVLVLLYLSWQAFATLVLIIPLSTAVSLSVSRKIRNLTKKERDSEALVLDVLTRSVSAFKMVRAFSLVSATIVVFKNSLENALESVYRKQRIILRLQRAGDLTMVASDVCSMFVGGYLVLLNRLTLGSFIAFMNAFWRAATTLIEVFNKVAEFHGYSATIDRVADFILTQAPRPSHITGTEASAQSLCFAYDGSLVLSDFSMSLKPGERCLVVGRNGTGKTTLANILCGHLAPTSGRLTLPARISGITLPLSFPPMIVRELPINAELLSLLGIDAPAILDARPDLLSAGQQQKVALGLALSCEADLYVLDEPLANIDVPSRAAAMRVIERRTVGRMLVMVMHDADEYRHFFDGVCLLETGRDHAQKEGRTHNHPPESANTGATDSSIPERDLQLASEKNRPS